MLISNQKFLTPENITCPIIIYQYINLSNKMMDTLRIEDHCYWSCIHTLIMHQILGKYALILRLQNFARNLLITYQATNQQLCYI